jgi:multidrug efflux pump subunit AcrB
LGASTLSVVDTVRNSLDDMEERLTRPGIGLKLVMDQSVYVRNSINALEQEGLLGALLCSLVILVFLGEWRMTLIAIFTLPLSILGAIICLYATGNTINVMTLGGLTMAIGPMVDSAIICLENTHRHLETGVEPKEAAFLGASEVAMPELIATLCTFLVLSPLALMEGMGQFLFRPMALAVAFAMICAYLLSRSLVPSYSALFLRSHGPGHGGAGHGDEHDQQADRQQTEESYAGDRHLAEQQAGAPQDAELHAGSEVHSAPRRGLLASAFARWEGVMEKAIERYAALLDRVMKQRLLTVVFAYGLLVLVVGGLWPQMRREFFPEVDSGAFEMAVRAPSGTRIELTNDYVAKVEDKIHEVIDEHDLQLVLSELGLTADWSAAYTPNAGPMDAIIKVQLKEHRHHSAQHYADALRKALQADPRFKQLEFAFNTGGLIRGALNEGKATPINIRVSGKDRDQTFEIAKAIKNRVSGISGIVDARVIQRMDYPQFTINVDRAKAADMGLTQAEVMKNVVAAVNSSISFNKKNFWIDPVSHNQYFVGVMYPEANIESLDTLLDIPITSHNQEEPVPLRSIATIERTTVPTEVKHINIQPTIDVTMGVSGRDLGHVAGDVSKVLNDFGRRQSDGSWAPYAPRTSESGDAGESAETLSGSKIVLSGEYERMQDTFYNLGFGLLMASLLIYFLMVALVRSWVVPLTVMLAVPLSLIGVFSLLYLTQTAINVQSLLGVIFVVGINVSNAVLLTDWAQELRRHEGLDPTTAIRKAAKIRVRPVTMTALAAFFAMVPGALAFELGSEANAPLARAILGGLLAVEPATLFVVPCLYSLMVRDRGPKPDPREQERLDTVAEPPPEIN